MNDNFKQVDRVDKIEGSSVVEPSCTQEGGDIAAGLWQSDSTHAAQMNDTSPAGHNTKDALN